MEYYNEGLDGIGYMSGIEYLDPISVWIAYECQILHLSFVRFLNERNTQLLESLTCFLDVRNNDSDVTCNQMFMQC